MSKNFCKVFHHKGRQIIVLSKSNGNYSPMVQLLFQYGTYIDHIDIVFGYGHDSDQAKLRDKEFKNMSKKRAVKLIKEKIAEDNRRRKQSEGNSGFPICGY